MLLAKIGQLVVWLEIANSDVAALQKQLANMEKPKENTQESTPDK
jgi:hypothetical protein